MSSATAEIATTGKPSGAVLAFRDKIRAQIEQARQTVEPAGSLVIRIKDKQFVLPDGTKSAGPMNCIILDFISSNSYFPGVYNPKKPAAPVCFSKGKIISEMVPSSHAEEPQSVSCSECKFNEFGSGAGNAKACKQTYQLAMVPATATPNAAIGLINVAPSSRKAWTNYVMDLAARGMSPAEVITGISIDPESEYAALEFECTGPHENYETCAKLYEPAVALLTREPKGKDKD